MTATIIATFVIGYLLIVFEHPLKLDKTVPALLMAAFCWALLAIGFFDGRLGVIDAHEQAFKMAAGAMDEGAKHGFENTLLHHLGKTAEILVFLIGAMTIVEIIDLHRGFEVLKSYVKTKKKKTLLWIVGGIGFILSAVIDNLTATIVLVTLLRKIIPDHKERIWFVSLIVIAANAGGAWSPIGDVTTTMLWIGGRVSSAGLMELLIVPALISFALPFFIASFMKPFQGEIS
ncbi:MAG TPA: sodium:proton antiporter, partial [Bacteroidetes bacterium]|nr:sodium:proton antiporter [Bacteroidota bacterium]